MRTRRTAVSLAVAAGLSLGACTAGDPAATDPTASASPSTGSSTEALAEASEVEDDRTPLEIWWFGHYNTWDTEASNRTANAHEQLVAECMAEEGWEYTPVDFTQIDDEPLPEAWQLDRMAYAEQYGYGIAFDDGAFREAEQRQAEDERSDPNAIYRDSLSPTAREEYDLDLTGAPPPTPEQIAAGELPEADTEGCQVIAGEQLDETSGPSVWEDPGYLAISEEIRLMREAIDKDVRLLEIRGEWTVCMDGAGFGSLVDSDAAYDRMWLAYDAATKDGEAPPAEQLAELQEDERAMAVADQRCHAETGIEHKTYELTRQFEREFVAKHQAEMEEIFARFEIGNEES